MYDVVVVGARCAGSPTAMLLARRGHRVLLVDRNEFPSDTLSTHFVQPPALARLRRWGLLDRLLDGGCPPLAPLRMDFGPIAVDGDAALDFGRIAIEGRPTPYDGVDFYCAPRRTYLDHMLVEAAVEAGVELRERTALEGLVTEGDRVVGVRLRGAGGEETTERASVVVGADGMRSAVARAVGAEQYQEFPSLTVGYYAYWSGVEDTRLAMTPRPGRNIAELPTHDELTCIVVSWSISDFREVRKDIEGHFHSSIDEHAPDLARRLEGATREERFKGTGVVPNFFRTPRGPGWALAGDAGLHKDPVGAHGIMDAFRDADLLSDALHAGLSGERPLDEALAAFHAERDALATPLYMLDVQLAALAPQRPMLVLLGAVATAGSDEDRAQFLGLMAGTVPMSDVFDPANVERLMGRADIPMTALAA